MNTKDFMENLFQRNQQSIANATKDLTQKELCWQPAPDGNSMAFLLWHIARAEDRNVQSTLLNVPQIWEAGNWAKKLGMDAGAKDFGYGYTPEQVACFSVKSPALLLEYANTVRKNTLDYVRGLTPQKLRRKIQHPNFGEMSVAQLMARVLGHLTEHTGQMGYVRGLIKGANK